MKTATTELNELTLRDDGILLVRSINGETHRTADAVERMYDELADLIDNQPCPILWDPRAIRTIRPGGWVAITDRLERLFTALAIVVDDQTVDLLSGYPASWNSLLMPVRQFEDEDEAMRWLAQFVQS